jgi:hypothetical protein
MTWDILPGREQEYFEFVVRDFIPGIQQMGMEPNDAWFTMYGSQPQIMVAAQVSTMSKQKKLLGSNDWKNLSQNLLDYVENRNLKVVPARGGFQL